MLKKRTLSKGTRFLVFLQVVAVTIPLIATRVRTNADFTFPPGTEGTDVNTPRQLDGGGAYFNPVRDDTRNQWQWHPGKGWVLETTSQTYENGWAWVWQEGRGWTWMQAEVTQTMGADEAVNARAEAIAAEKSATEASPSTSQGCLDADGSWTSDRDFCAHEPVMMDATENDTLAPQAPMQRVIPDKIRSALEEARVLTPAEEREVKIILEDRFSGADVLKSVEPVVSRTASDIIRKLSALKDSAGTTEARDYLVARIAAAQDLSQHLSDAETKADVVAVTNELKSLASDAEQFVRENGIVIPVDPATPTGMALVKQSEKILLRLPKVFDVLEENELPTETLENMFDETWKTLETVRVRCETQNRCDDVRDVIEQIEQVVSAIKGLADASGDSKLRYEIEQSFSN